MRLTHRQEEVLQFICDYMDDTGRPPTRAEMAEEFGFCSKNAAEAHLRTLARKGVIQLLPGVSRGIKVVRRRTNQLPLVNYRRWYT